MFVVMFEFVVKEGCEQAFLDAWPKVTQGIYMFKGSLGSRLHRTKNGELIAYAQWPDRATYELANQQTMSEQYETHRAQMRAALNIEQTRIIYEMDVAVDYLQRRPFAI
ncbi:antibiotic biosynthesis monooxygenase [Neiella marina]|uniref:Antibiotic biosynthesis monooxygenase n=1 Tax=Neiella holothuriorum TaxID=2870530 RepID=A0ABS7EJ87_9GAMM|nr:antibiotic biosynthesis monooxygenase [Neiella holothuriorum]MBW8192418.1 antibiotic biosynthesis monooxygenase [Neiella holothuriorum]